MTLVVDMSYVLTVLYASVRAGALFLVTPLFVFTQIPARVRLLLVLALAIFLAMEAKVPLVNSPVTLGGLTGSLIMELFLGALLGFGVIAAFGAFLIGGRIVDVQMGFGVTGLIDPATRDQVPLIGTMLEMMAVVTFFLVNGHHYLLRGLAYSFEKVPPGTSLSKLTIEPIVSQFGLMFIYGLAITAPVIVALLLIDVGMSFMARTMPQMNVFIVALPIKIFVGLVVLVVSLGYLSPLLEKIYISIFRYWETVIS